MICITTGDANGVGPEILLTSVGRHLIEGEYVVIGDKTVLDACAAALGAALGVNAAGVRCTPMVVKNPEEAAEFYRSGASEAAFPFIDAGVMTAADIAPGTLSKTAGDAAYQYVETATRLALNGEVSAIVTLPMNKEATRMSHPRFTGHTELIADLCGQTDYTMMLIFERFAVTHVSTHVSLAEALRLVRRERVETVIRLTQDALSRLSPEPRIAVAGLNPHAGEHGAFGREDMEEILPAVKAARARGWNVVGPEPPDTVFYRAAKGQFDGIVCMYHDQGHIPMKLLDFEGGVNVTLGLSVVRTSVDHGTAFDIAWKGKASTRSFVQACRFAQRLARPD